MAQRTNPARRIPGNPLAGILRALSQQARYSDRRRSSTVPTVLSDASAAAGGGATAVELEQAASLFAEVAPPQSDAEETALAAEFEAALRQAVIEAAPVAVSQVLETAAATAVTDGTGTATVTYGPYETAPVVVVTAVADIANTATVVRADGWSATVAVRDATGTAVTGATVAVAVHATTPRQ